MRSALLVSDLDGPARQDSDTIWRMPPDGAPGPTDASMLEIIRRDIVTGRFPPGSELSLGTLSDELGVSMITVRDALLQLVQQRIVERSAHSVFRVVSISRQHLVELTALRMLVECAALSESIERADASWRADVATALEALEAAETEAEDDLPSARDDWRTAHAVFHDTLCSGTASGRLLDLTRTLRDEAEIYRQLAGRSVRVRSHLDVTAEHRALGRLAIAGASDDAQDLLRRHLDGTMRTLLGEVV